MKIRPKKFLFLFLLTVTTATAHSPEFTNQFFEESCKFTSTGRNPYFILLPGHQIVLEGDDEGELVRVVVTVQDKIKIVNGVETRVVKERETVDGELVEISRNYFAICKKTNSVFYFGEDVDIYDNGEVVSHDGSWLAGVNGARPGIIMPGTLLLGARYFQETAQGVALDRAEITRLDAAITTPSGHFTDLLKTKETSPLEPGHVSIKFYARGIGLIKDGTAELISFDANASTVDADR
ncbi:hypothetical protein L0222_02640 [bacterium]|nr:hypothetical protein [bacterium]MCI0604413.1 hypothetical protein [bacterium]